MVAEQSSPGSQPPAASANSPGGPEPSSAATGTGGRQPVAGPAAGPEPAGSAVGTEGPAAATGLSSDLATAEPGEERVSTLELFFDLVFVFGFTQITSSISDETTAISLAHGVLVFAVLWWAWGAYAWLTNTVTTGEMAPRVVVLCAMAAMLVTALAVPSAFAGGGEAFAIGYLVVMILHAALFVLAGENPETTRAAIIRLSATNLPAAALLVAAGAADGTAQTVLWLTSITLCYAGPYITGVAGFTVHPGHFVERHGLVVIIALGESIVALGTGGEEITLDWRLAGTGLVVVALVIGLWWAYFDADALDAERDLARSSGVERARLARDVYSYLHIPIVLGIVLAAIGIHEVFVHPGSSLDPVVGGAVGAGVALFFAALAAIRLRRGVRPGPLHVAAIVAGVAVAAASPHIPAVAAFGVLATVVLGVAIADRWHHPAPAARADGASEADMETPTTTG